MPRTPKPPGTRMPSQVASSSATSPSVSRSLSTHTTSTRPPWCEPAGWSASLARAAGGGAGVVERLDRRQVRVGELVVLADQRDPHGIGGGLDPLHEAL